MKWEDGIFFKAQKMIRCSRREQLFWVRDNCIHEQEIIEKQESTLEATPQPTISPASSSLSTAMFNKDAMPVSFILDHQLKVIRIRRSP